jgi:hypothetical protein
MKFNLESGRMYLFAAAALGAILALSFTAQPVFAAPNVTLQETSLQASHAFIANATFVNATVNYNFLGEGGNDTYTLAGGNFSGSFVATDLKNGTFNVVTGNPQSGTNATIFSMMGGANSTFNIIQKNANGTVSLVIVGGSNSLVNASSIGNVANTVLSINLGVNSTAIIGSHFSGNITTVNIVM